MSEKRINITQYGNPEVMTLEEFSLPEPEPGTARVKIMAAGVNFIDVYQRKGEYKSNPPILIGSEGAGIVEAANLNTFKIKTGDRVAWTGLSGSYATHGNFPINRLVKLPDTLSYEQGAACMLQGMTAHYLACSAYPLQVEDKCLIHAGAGGVGQLLSQIAKMKGAFVITTVSTGEKKIISQKAGADEVILYTQVDFEKQVQQLTRGEGVQVVYDSVGRQTFEKSLNCLCRRGYLVLFGQSSGAVPSLDPQTLNAKGSLYLTRPKLGDYIESREELLWRSGEIFNWILSGKLKLNIDKTFPLLEAAKAHHYLENRETKGKVLLIP
jgi:NADPH2:quinone reductase